MKNQVCINTRKAMTFLHWTFYYIPKGYNQKKEMSEILLSEISNWKILVEDNNPLLGLVLRLVKLSALPS